MVAGCWSTGAVAAGANGVGGQRHVAAGNGAARRLTQGHGTTVERCASGKGDVAERRRVPVDQGHRERSLEVADVRDGKNVRLPDEGAAVLYREYKDLAPRAASRDLDPLSPDRSRQRDGLCYRK